MLVFDIDKNKDGLFKLHLHIKGDKFTAGVENDHSIFFILKGKIKITKQNSENKIFGSNTMFFCSKNLGPYQATILDDTLFIELSAENIFSFVDMAALNKIIFEHSPNMVELEKVYIKKLLRNFLFNIVYYKQNNISSRYIQDVKRKEFIYLLKALYSKQAIARFFSTLYIYQNEFKLSVLTNYTDDCTAKTLAEKCFMTTKTFTRRFKSEFKTTPHKWITEQKIKKLEYSLTHEIQSRQEILDKFHFSNQAELIRFCLKHNIEYNDNKAGE